MARSLFPLANIDEMTGDCGGGGHGRRNEMRTALETLTALEITVRRGRTALARLQPVVIHGKTHRAARLAPVKTGSPENLVEAFRFRLLLDQARTRNDHGIDRDLGAVKITVDSAKDALDHRYLNEIAGLELPTLETIAIWLWRRIAPDLPALAEIGIYRDSCGEGCEYQGEFETLEEAA